MKWSHLLGLLALAGCITPPVCSPKIVYVPGPVQVVTRTVYVREPARSSALQATYEDLHQQEAAIVLKGKPRAIYKLIGLDMAARRALEPVQKAPGRPSVKVAKPAIKAIGDLQACVTTGCQ